MTIAFLAGFIAAACVVALFALTAPEGWEDSEGFHYGRED